MKVLPTIVDTAANLTALNEIIPDGVLCKESKSNRFKVGDGVHKYSALPYVADEALTIANQALTTANNTFTNLNNLLPPTIDSSPLSHSTKLGDILLQCGKSPANNAQSAQIQGDIAVEVKDILSTYPETKYIWRLSTTFPDRFYSVYSLAVTPCVDTSILTSNNDSFLLGYKVHSPGTMGFMVMFWTTKPNLVTFQFNWIAIGKIRA